ncbi:PEP-CTERM-box response regulator transcription factor [Psychrobium sp. 1_MG-2023]|uniref:PEP-CTERM-box response regulator transcription factor n=1 Tax=Psychrobium sp. 1_MG-2023 TaxID=3062624 RepID=UPI000C348830|nr:PEP-CTERM-box response regulator transcription factor [Psychrobium sp. 1_MG-2023]MDP2561117.1 PEP-CTERM-box response regulator transcription factor [Psychrobium sp. 1_MG-2023]PKF55093.1 PEP-CTERM-box response regulator transcription factor [Alteromonadales bacterium alter-6D02]
MSQIKPKILVIDDDPGILKQLKWSLSDFDIITAENQTGAMAQMRLHAPTVVTLDLGLPPDPTNASEGLATLTAILSFAPHTKVIVITGNDDRKNAVKAIALGATDFFQKPVEPDILIHFLTRALHLYQLEEENRRLNLLAPSVNNIIGSSQPMQRVIKMVERIAKNNITTLLLGESGTGKEVLAKAIHQLSDRKNKPFIAINCASIPENLLESELFGYEKGAFTGAHKQTKGKIECAHGGTLFLDEIGDMPLNLQAKMLRFLQERLIERIGGRQEIEIDIRVICATHRNLEEMINQEFFREDLFYRINEICINIPALRERDSDIILLSKTILKQFNEELNAKIKGFTPEAINALMNYSWPGNIRELQNKIKSAVIMSDNNYIDELELGLNASTQDNIIVLRDVRAQAESKAIVSAYELCNGNMSKTAEQLGVTRPTLYALIEKYNINELVSS